MEPRSGKATSIRAARIQKVNRKDYTTQRARSGSKLWLSRLAATASLMRSARPPVRNVLFGKVMADPLPLQIAQPNHSTLIADRQPSAISR
jgi:hypothetical protein